MSTLPKPRYPVRPGGVWPRSRIHPLPPVDPSTPEDSSLLGLGPDPSSLSSDPLGPEPGAWAIVSLRLQQARTLLRRLARWWMAADFRRLQLPILVVAFLVWTITARTAWNGYESATPLLAQRMAEIREARAQAAPTSLNLAPAAPSTASRAATTSSAKAVRTPAPVGSVLPERAAAPVANTAPRANRGLARILAASIESWFSPEPAPPERVQGNPRTRVWVDLKTGLYYCPGADYYGYGGRDRGKVMSQKAAEYEYFQPATGAPCE